MSSISNKSLGIETICNMTFLMILMLKFILFNQMSSVLDSIWHALEEYMQKKSEFSRKSDKIDYGQVTCL